MSDPAHTTDDRSDLAALSDERLEAEMTDLAAHLNAATARFLALVAEHDRRRVWADHGCRSEADYLSWRCGITPYAAREQIGVAHRLAAVPKVKDAFTSGELSYYQVRAMARVAEDCDEDMLLNYVRHSTASQSQRFLGAFAKAYRSYQRDVANEVHFKRYLRFYYDDDGAFVLNGRMSGDDGAIVEKALAAAKDELWDVQQAARKDVPPDSEPYNREMADDPGGASYADALVAIAETSLETSPKARAGGDRYQVMIHVDPATLAGGDGGGGGDGGERCEIDGGPAIAPETAQRIVCDSSLVTMVEAGGEPHNVGRKRRSISTALRRALHARDGCCVFPGCWRKRFTDAHHVRYRSRGGEDKLDNLALLCRFHHRLVHEGGYGMHRNPDGSFTFTRPNGTVVPHVPEPLRARGPDIARQNRAAGLAIDDTTCHSLWDGTKITKPVLAEIVDGLWPPDERDPPPDRDPPPRRDPPIDPDLPDYLQPLGPS